MDAYLDRIDNVMAHIMEEWQDIPLYDQIFEASDEEVEKANDLGGKSVGLLQKAIAALKTLFRKIKEMISNAIDYLFASKEEQQSFEEFIKEAKSDPELAKTKITFHDYREIITGLDKDCKDFENQYQQFKQSQADDAPSLKKAIQERVDDYSDKFKKIVATEGASVALEAAIVYAQQCRAHSIQVQQMINFDIGLLDALEDQLGKKEIQKFKNKIKHLNSEYDIVRKIYGGRQLQGKTATDALKEVTTKLRHIWSTQRRARKGKHGDEVKKVQGGILKAGLHEFIHKDRDRAKVDVTNAMAGMNEKKAARMEKKNAQLDKKIDKKEAKLNAKAKKMSLTV